jgi:hypothetical protein
MNNKFIAEATTIINAPVSKVWQALVNPKIIKQYLFGTDVITDWKVGSPITYGENGKESLSRIRERSCRSSAKSH